MRCGFCAIHAHQPHYRPAPVADLVDAALVESSARMDGRQIVMVLAPKPKKKQAGH